MNKGELAKSLSEKFDLTATKANEVVSHVLDTISGALAKNDTVQLIGFGSFSVRKRKARNGRNPRTGETIKIPASKTVGFSVGSALKELVNKK